jgi:single-strand DNA-binding protein
MELNEVKVIGRFVKDPELKEVGKDNTSVAQFALAVNTSFGKDKQETAYIDCEAWNKTAETIGKYCEKGREILVTGRIKQDTWSVDLDDGTTVNRSKLKLVVNNFSFGRSAGGGEDEEGEAPKRKAKAGNSGRKGKSAKKLFS